VFIVLGYITLVPARISTSPHRQGRGCKEAMADQDEFLMDSDTSHEDEEEGGHHVLKILELSEGSRDSTHLKVKTFQKNVASYGLKYVFFFHHHFILHELTQLLEKKF
jgi:hypothetical protein